MTTPPSTAGALFSSTSRDPACAQPAAAVYSSAAPPVPQRPDLPRLLQRRDAAFIDKATPWLSVLVDRYFRTEVQGAEHLTDQRALYVCTHNGGYFTPDLYGLMLAFWRRNGSAAPSYGLMHEAIFRIPGLKSFLTRCGALSASHEHGRLVLEAGYPLLVCPGGDLDALKPFSQRHHITFGPRRGFIRLALEQQVPIIPVVSVGAHEVMVILNDGQRLARRLRMDRLFRIKTVPIALSFPLGLTPAGLPSLPLPAKIRLRVLPPIQLGEPAAAVADPRVVERCFEHVRCTMQAGLDDLAVKRRWLFG